MWGMKQIPAALAPKTKKHLINQPHTIIDKKTPGDCFASLAMTGRRNDRTKGQTHSDPPKFKWDVVV
jgi:hypothetical protein